MTEEGRTQENVDIHVADLTVWNAVNRIHFVRFPQGSSDGVVWWPALLFDKHASLQLSLMWSLASSTSESSTQQASRRRLWRFRTEVQRYRARLWLESRQEHHDKGDILALLLGPRRPCRQMTIRLADESSSNKRDFYGSLESLREEYTVSPSSLSWVQAWNEATDEALQILERSLQLPAADKQLHPQAPQVTPDPTIMPLLQDADNDNDYDVGGITWLDEEEEENDDNDKENESETQLPDTQEARLIATTKTATKQKGRKITEGNVTEAGTGIEPIVKPKAADPTKSKVNPSRASEMNGEARRVKNTKTLVKKTATKTNKQTPATPKKQAKRTDMGFPSPTPRKRGRPAKQVVPSQTPKKQTKRKETTENARANDPDNSKAAKTEKRAPLSMASPSPAKKSRGRSRSREKSENRHEMMKAATDASEQDLKEVFAQDSPSVQNEGSSPEASSVSSSSSTDLFARSILTSEAAWRVLMVAFKFRTAQNYYCYPDVEPTNENSCEGRDYFKTLVEMRRHLCAYGLPMPPNVQKQVDRIIATKGANLEQAREIAYQKLLRNPQELHGLVNWIRLAHVKSLEKAGSIPANVEPLLLDVKAWSKLVALGGYHYAGGKYFLPGHRGMANPVEGRHCFQNLHDILRHSARFGIDVLEMKDSNKHPPLDLELYVIQSVDTFERIDPKKEEEKLSYSESGFSATRSGRLRPNATIPIFDLHSTEDTQESSKRKRGSSQNSHCQSLDVESQPVGEEDDQNHAETSHVTPDAEAASPSKRPKDPKTMSVVVSNGPSSPCTAVSGCSMESLGDEHLVMDDCEMPSLSLPENTSKEAIEQNEEAPSLAVSSPASDDLRKGRAEEAVEDEEAPPTTDDLKESSPEEALPEEQALPQSDSSPAAEEVRPEEALTDEALPTTENLQEASPEGALTEEALPVTSNLTESHQDEAPAGEETPPHSDFFSPAADPKETQAEKALATEKGFSQSDSSLGAANLEAARTEKAASAEEVLPESGASATIGDLKNRNPEQIRAEKAAWPHSSSSLATGHSTANEGGGVQRGDPERSSRSATGAELDSSEKGSTAAGPLVVEPKDTFHGMTLSIASKLNKCTELLQARETMDLAVISSSSSSKFGAQFSELRQFFLENVGSTNGNRSLYVCGGPGTGKTTAARRCIEEAKALEAQSNATLRSCFVFINAAHMQSPAPAPSNCHPILAQIASELDVPDEPGDLAGRIEKFLVSSAKSHTQQKRVVLVLDEVDLLLSSSSSFQDAVGAKEKVLKTVFEWAVSPDLFFTVVGISNSVANSVAQRVQKLGKIENKIVFSPYREDDLVSIIESRIGPHVIDKPAVQFVCRKVAASSGDARQALELTSNAIGKCLASMNEEQRLMPSCDGQTIVKLPHMMRAVREGTGMKHADLIAGLPQAAKVVLCVAVALGQVSPAWRVIRMQTLRKYCQEASSHSVLEGVGIEHLGDLVQQLTDAGLLLVGETSQDECFWQMECNPFDMPLRLAVQLEDVECALEKSLWQDQFYKNMVDYVRRHDLENASSRHLVGPSLCGT